MTSHPGFRLFVLGIWVGVTLGGSARSRYCVDKFRIHQNHTMCLGEPSEALEYSETVEIEAQHNYIRGNVNNPPASKMMEIDYSRLLEIEAQVWADTCSMEHDDPYLRFIPNRFHVGQNIYISDGVDLSWTEVIGRWANESTDFNQTTTSTIHGVANYTQIVWEDTKLVGCGKKQCGHSFFYVCNYGPGMDPRRFSTPYQPGKTGELCQNNYGYNSTGLCGCAGLYCANGAELDMATCQCQCLSGTQLYSGLACELNCSADIDHPDCGTMHEAACRTDRMAPFKCPWMCKVCPYGGTDYREGSVRMPWETTTTISSTPADRTTGSTAGPGNADGALSSSSPSLSGNTDDPQKLFSTPGPENTKTALKSISTTSPGHANGAQKSATTKVFGFANGVQTQGSTSVPTNSNGAQNPGSSSVPAINNGAQNQAIMTVYINANGANGAPLGTEVNSSNKQSFEISGAKGSIILVALLSSCN